MSKTRRQFLQQIAATAGVTFIAPRIEANSFDVDVNTRRPVLDSWGSD